MSNWSPISGGTTTTRNLWQLRKWSVGWVIALRIGWVVAHVKSKMRNHTWRCYGTCSVPLLQRSFWIRFEYVAKQIQLQLYSIYIYAYTIYCEYMMFQTICWDMCARKWTLVKICLDSIRTKSLSSLGQFWHVLMDDPNPTYEAETNPGIDEGSKLDCTCIISGSFQWYIEIT